MIKLFIAILILIAVYAPAADIVLGKITDSMPWVSEGDNNKSIRFVAGGIITNYIESGTNFTAHIFLSNGTFTVSGGSLNCDVLVVAGGGAGGGDYYGEIGRAHV